MDNRILGSLDSTFVEPLSIAMVAACPFPTRQGTQVLIRHLATALASAGHDVHLITYGYGEYEQSFQFRLHRSLALDAGLRSGPHFMKPVADAALMLTASKVVKNYDCDVLHVHNVEGLGIGIVLKQMFSIPLVYHVHNSMGLELPTYFDTRLAKGFASITGDLIDRILPKAADSLITFNEDHKSLHEAFGLDSGSIHVVPAGLLANELLEPCEKTITRFKELLGPGPWLLYAGNADSYQNLSLLWESFHWLRKHRDDVKILIATNGETELFEKQFQHFSFGNSIRVLRYQSLEELRALFALGTIGVCPRTIWTGVPIKILNYMSAGLPVVACKSSARHLVREDAGKLVDDNPIDFGRAILKLLQNPPSKANIARSSRRFRIDEQIEMYEQVYRKLLYSKQVN